MTMSLVSSNNPFYFVVCKNPLCLRAFDLEDEKGIKPYAHGKEEDFWDHYIEAQCPHCFVLLGYDGTSDNKGDVHAVQEREIGKKAQLVLEAENQALRERIIELGNEIEQLETLNQKQKESSRRKAQKLQGELIKLTKAYDRLSRETDKLSRKVVRGS